MPDPSVVLLRCRHGKEQADTHIAAAGGVSVLWGRLGRAVLGGQHPGVCVQRCECVCASAPAQQASVGPQAWVYGTGNLTNAMSCGGCASLDSADAGCCVQLQLLLLLR